MAADAYIHVAANQLRDAVAELQKEARQAQLDTYDRQVQLNREASNAEYEAASLKLEKEGVSDGQRKREADRRMQQLQQQVAQKRGEATKRGNDAAGLVQSKTQLVVQLQSVISQLESLAVSAR